MPGPSSRLVRAASRNHHDPSVPTAARRAAVQYVTIVVTAASDTSSVTCRRVGVWVAVPTASTAATATTGNP
ncbi:MAG: hypothetical protein V9G12_25930 [Microthrixaceae bacterium]